MDWISVCTLNDIAPDTGICALVGTEQVAIFRCAGSDRLHAVGNYDPIGKANVLSRGMLAELNGNISVASPLYKHHYNLNSGQCIELEDVSIPVYAVQVRDGSVEIGLA